MIDINTMGNETLDERQPDGERHEAGTEECCLPSIVDSKLYRRLIVENTANMNINNFEKSMSLSQKQCKKFILRGS